MKEKINGKFVAYFNSILYLIFIVLVVGGIFQSRVGQFSSDQMPYMRMLYFLIPIVLVVITFVVMVGLVKFRAWGRGWAIIWNLCVAFQLVGLEAIGYLVIIMMTGSAPEDFRYFDFDTLLWLIMAIILIFLSVALSRETVKKEFH